MRSVKKALYPVLAVMAILLNLVPSSLAYANYASDASGDCKGGVVYYSENDPQTMYCITGLDPQDPSENANPLIGNSTEFHWQMKTTEDIMNFSSTGLNSTANQWGYLSPPYNTTQKGASVQALGGQALGTCDSVHIGTSDYPLAQNYNGSQQCSQSATSSTSCGGISPRVNNDVDKVLSCTFVKVNNAGVKESIMYCNSVLFGNICRDQGSLRANITSISGPGNQEEISDAIGSTGSDGHPSGSGIQFYCNQTSVVGFDQIPDTNPPQNYPYNYYESAGFPIVEKPPTAIDSGSMPALSDCCTDQSSGTISGKIGPYQSNKVDSNGFCQWNPSAATVNATCAKADYRASHQNECECTFDSTAGVSNGNTYTALGCIPSNVGAVINIFLSIAIGIAALAALIMMVVGGYEIMTNPAGPDEIKEGQQYIVNAILGLLLIIFCVIVLRIIGVDVLGIAELSKLL